MCVIAALPQKKVLTKEQVLTMWKRNDDGGGFAYLHPGGDLKVYKTMDFGQYWSTFNGVQQEFGEQSDILLHFRIATHGVTDLSNVHPFQVDDHTVMAHNGVISSVPNDKVRSDTRVFVEDFLPDLPEDWLDNKFIVKMVEKFIGQSKLMFLTKNPALKKEVYILNEQMGTRHDGVWYSNTFSLPTHAKGSYTYQGGAGWMDDWDEDRWFPSSYGYSSSAPKPMGATAAVQTRARVFKAPYSKEREAFLKKDRDEVLGLLHDVTWATETKMFICTGCLSVVDEEDYGSCMCFDKACTTCLNFTSACDEECLTDSTRKVMYPTDLRFQRILEGLNLEPEDVLMFDKHTVCEVVDLPVKGGDS